MSETAIKERPILFKGEMVRAILDGRKTQTRRIVKPQPVFHKNKKLPWEWKPSGKDLPVYNWCRGHKKTIDCVHCCGWLDFCPYGKPGDQLWVRETCFSDGASLTYVADHKSRHFCLKNETNYQRLLKLHHYGGGYSRNVPSIHMPRWASRITLEITDVRVERLNDISGTDAFAEGVTVPSHFSDSFDEARYTFAELWESINGPGSWNANPWVWVVEFRRLTDA